MVKNHHKTKNKKSSLRASSSQNSQTLIPFQTKHPTPANTNHKPFSHSSFVGKIWSFWTCFFGKDLMAWSVELDLVMFSQFKENRRLQGRRVHWVQQAQGHHWNPHLHQNPWLGPLPWDPPLRSWRPPRCQSWHQWCQQGWPLPQLHQGSCECLLWEKMVEGAHHRWVQACQLFWG